MSKTEGQPTTPAEFAAEMEALVEAFRDPLDRKELTISEEPCLLEFAVGAVRRMGALLKTLGYGDGVRWVEAFGDLDTYVHRAFPHL